MKRRLKRVAFVGLAVAALAALVGLGWVAVVRSSDRGRLQAILDHLDATDPGWRLEHLLAAREAAFPPDDRNPVLVTQAAKGQTPRAFNDWQLRVQERHADDGGDWLPDPELNRLPWDEDIADAACTRYECRDVITVARRLRNLTAPGGVRLTISPDVIGTLLPHVQNVREVAALLQLDALAAALEDDPNQAVESAHAGLNARHAIGDEPFLISQLVRTATDAIAARTAEWVLAWGEPTAGLAELQAAFAEEAEVPRFLIGIRGERAMANRLFENMSNGTVKPGPLIAALGSRPNNGFFATPLLALQYRAYGVGDHARSLELLTEMIDAAKGPPHELRRRLNRVEIPPPTDVRYLLTRLLIPACEKIGDSDLRIKAQLRCAAVGIACERFRQKHKRWPATLAEIPKGILSAVPLDPFDGQPLRYAVYPGGAVVYSVGLDEADDGGNVSVQGKPGTDYGFRLWDADRRRAEPLPRPRGPGGDPPPAVPLSLADPRFQVPIP